MKTWVTWLRWSMMSPLATNRLASLPGSSEPIRSATEKISAGDSADELAPLGGVAIGEQRRHRHVDEIGIAVPGLAVGQRQLVGLDEEVDEIGADGIELVEVEPVEQRQAR